MLTWLLLLREGDDNPEARYAIRSWVANAGPVDRLVTVGYRPTWLESDEHIPANDHRSGPLNVWHNLRTACESGVLSGDVVVANDDMFAVESVDPLTVNYRCPLRDHVKRLRPGTWWGASMRLTLAALRKRGIEAPLSYELHRPLPIDADAMARVLRECWSGAGIPPQWRTLYGNVEQIGGEQSSDCKVYNRATDAMHGPWVSTTDGTWRNSDAGKHVRATFTEPSRWEVA